MNARVQKIKIGSETAIVVPISEWNQLMSTLEDLSDIVAYDRAKKRDDGTRYTSEEMREIILGKKYMEPLMVNETPAKYDVKPRSKTKSTARRPAKEA